MLFPLRSLSHLLLHISIVFLFLFLFLNSFSTYIILSSFSFAYFFLLFFYFASHNFRLKHFINHWQRMYMYGKCTYLRASEPSGDNCIAWQSWTSVARATVFTWHCLQTLRRSLAFVQNYMLQYIFTSFRIKYWLELLVQWHGTARMEQLYLSRVVGMMVTMLLGCWAIIS